MLNNLWRLLLLFLDEDDPIFIRVLHIWARSFVRSTSKWPNPKALIPPFLPPHPPPFFPAQKLLSLTGDTAKTVRILLLLWECAKCEIVGGHFSKEKKRKRKSFENLPPDIKKPLTVFISNKKWQHLCKNTFLRRSMVSLLSPYPLGAMTGDAQN